MLVAWNPHGWRCGEPTKTVEASGGDGNKRNFGKVHGMPPLLSSLWPMIMSMLESGKLCWNNTPKDPRDERPVCVFCLMRNVNPIASMYDIFHCIYHKNIPNVGCSTIHGSHGYSTIRPFVPWNLLGYYWIHPNVIVILLELPLTSLFGLVLRWWFQTFVSMFIHSWISWGRLPKMTHILF